MVVDSGMQMVAKELEGNQWNGQQPHPMGAQSQMRCQELIALPAWAHHKDKGKGKRNSEEGRQLPQVSLTLTLVVRIWEGGELAQVASVLVVVVRVMNMVRVGQNLWHNHSNHSNHDQHHTPKLQIRLLDLSQTTTARWLVMSLPSKKHAASLLLLLQLLLLLLLQLLLLLAQRPWMVAVPWSMQVIRRGT